MGKSHKEEIMITHVKTKGFKGFDIDEGIHFKTIFCGENTSGKSSRGAAIALAILGFIPFAAKTTKNNAEILKDFGQGKTLTVSVICNGVEFERHFSRSEKGTVSQRLRVNKKKYSAADYSLELFKAGNPQIVSVNDFIAMSDQKKIDTLFEIFPPEADLKNLDNQIDTVKKTISDLEKSKGKATGAVQRLTESKNEIELPVGTLAEIQEEITNLTQQVKDAQDNLKGAEIEQAKAEATEKANSESQAKLDKAINQGGSGAKPTSKQTEKHIDDYVADTSGPQRIHTFVSEKPFDSEIDPAESIQRILDALNQSGCEVCAAAIIAKQELKKFKKEAAA